MLFLGNNFLNISRALMYSIFFIDRYENKGIIWVQPLRKHDDLINEINDIVGYMENNR